MSMLNEAKRGDLIDDRDRSFMGKLKSLLPWKGDAMGEVIRKLVYLCAVVVLIYSLVDAYNYQFGTSDMHNDKDSLTNLYNQGSTTPSNPSNNNNQNTVVPDSSNGNTDSDNNDEQQGNADTPAVDPDSPYPAGMLSKFEPLYDINSELIGWFVIDGFGDENGNYIEYPVVQGEDNDYYLSHDFFKNEKSYGALFADARGTISATKNPDVTIIYGHNMRSGGFFTKLHEYKKKASFVREHNVVSYSTLWEENDYIIFGCFLTGVREDQDDIPLFKYHNILNFSNDLAKFDYWYKNILYRNYYLTDIECTIEDEYLVMSTCSNDIYDARLVVVARKLREGEDPSQYTYISNANVRLPAVFYETYKEAVRPENDTGPAYEYYDPENPDAKYPYVPTAKIDEAEIEYLLESYIKINDCLMHEPSAIGEVDISVTDESGLYCKVIDESIDTWDEWQGYLRSIFAEGSDPLQYYSTGDMMKNIDGFTYANIGASGNDLSKEYTYEITSNTPQSIILSLNREYTTEGAEGTYYSRNIAIVKTDNGWRITG